MNTPILDEIVEEIHRRANKEDGENCDFTVTIEAHLYNALCLEETQNSTLYKGHRPCDCKGKK